MRAGLLARESITFQRNEESKTVSGQLVKIRKDVCTTRCNVIKQKGNEKEEAQEIFQTSTLIFQIRFNHLIKDTDTILYNGASYKVVLIDKNIWDRSMKITGTQINE